MLMARNQKEPVAEDAFDLALNRVVGF